MDIYKKLPLDIRRKFFMHFRHPVAVVFNFHFRPDNIRNLMADIRDYPISLKILYTLPFAKDHDGIFGRARLLNSLWVQARFICGNYYKIWEKNVSSSMYQERRMVDTMALCGQLSQISNKFLVGIIYKRRKKKLSTKIY